MPAYWMNEIKQGLRRTLPELELSLYPPASEDEIAAAENALKLTFPEPLRALYRLHNGQADDGPGLFFGLPLLPLEDIVREWSVWESLMDEYGEEGSHYSVPAGWIEETYIHPGWVPISHDWGGNHLGVDVQPGPLGLAGQMINFGRDEETKYVIARSCTDLLQFIAETVQVGHYTVTRDADGVTWSYGRSANRHFLDVIRELTLPVLQPEASPGGAVSVQAWLSGLTPSWREIVGQTEEEAKSFLERKTLMLVQSGISDLNPLTACADVRELVLSVNDISDVSPLAHCRSLKKLYIGRNPLRDLSPLQALPALAELIVSDTQVADFSPLAAVGSLRRLTATASDSSAVLSLLGLRQLQQLDLRLAGTVTEDVWAHIGQLSSLTHLTLEGSHWKDLAFLLGCPKLRSLTLKESTIANSSALAALPQLRELELQGCDDIGELETLISSPSLQRFSGSFQQFRLLHSRFDRPIDFSKIIGSMSEEESSFWRQSLR